MLIPNLDCKVYKQTAPDVYGQVTSGPAIPERCCVVKLKKKSDATTVRADSGASRAHADEFITENRILLTPKTKAAIDDRLDVAGVSIRVKSMFPRFDILGRLDHYEVEGELWA